MFVFGFGNSDGQDPGFVACFHLLGVNVVRIE